MMDKLKFWKKQEFEMPSDLPPPAEIPGMTPGTEAPSMEQPPAFGSDFQQEPQSSGQPGFQSPSSPQFSARAQFSQPSAAQFTPAPQFNQQPQFAPISQDQQLALISSKLDTVKAQLETVLQRLDRLERKGDERPYEQRWKSMM